MPTTPSNSKMFIAALRQLPPLMRRVIGNQALVDNAIAIGEQYHLTPEQETALMTIERNVIIQDLPVSKIPAEIKNIGLPPEQTGQLTKDFLGRIILPMEWYVGNVQSMIQAYGGRAEEYVAEARQQFPEVYAPHVEQPQANGASGSAEHPLLQGFDDKITTPRGRADLLLHLTGLATQIDDLMKNETMSQTAGENLMRNLDTLSFAVNTQDLNPLEVQALKRRLRKVLASLPTNDHPPA